MTLQEPVLRAVGLEFYWAPPPRFPDVRGAITDVLRDATGRPSNWQWEQGLVSASDEDRRLYLLAEPRGLDAVSEQPDPSAALAAARSVLQTCMDLLNVQALERCGVILTWTMAAESTSVAEAVLEQSMLASDLRSKLEPIGGRPSAVTFSARFANATETETELQVEVAADSDMDRGPYFISSVKADDFAPGNVVVGISRRMNGHLTAQAAHDRVTRFIDQLMQQSIKVLTTLASVRTPS